MGEEERRGERGREIKAKAALVKTSKELCYYTVTPATSPAERTDRCRLESKSLSPGQAEEARECKHA